MKKKSGDFRLKEIAKRSSRSRPRETSKISWRKKETRPDWPKKISRPRNVAESKRKN